MDDDPALTVSCTPGAQLLAADVATLLPHQWVNDNVLAFYLDYLCSTLYPGVPCAALNSGVASLCQILPPSELGEALRHTALGPTCPALLLPLCNARDFATPLAGTHWTLLHWVRSSPGFVHYDSTAHSSASASASLETAQLVAGSLAPLLGVAPAAAAILPRPCAQRQANAHDCGLHVAATMEGLVAGLAGQPLAAPLEAAAMRARILAVASQRCRSPGAAPAAFWAAFHAQHGPPAGLEGPSPLQRPPASTAAQP